MKCLKNNSQILLSFFGFMFLVITTWSQTPQFKSIQVTPKIAETEILQISQDSLGFLWLGSNQGIIRFDGVEPKFLALPDSLKQHKVTCQHIGKNNIVFGFENGAIAEVTIGSFKLSRITKLSDSPISSITTDDKDSIWAGTNGSGLYHLGMEGIKLFTSSDGLPDDYIHSIELINHHIAVATDLGLAVCAFANNKFSSRIYTNEDGLTDNLITSLKSNGDNNLLMGMHNGTVCNLNLESNRIDQFTAFNSLSISPIQKILQLGEEILLITEGDGAFILSWADRMKVQQFQLHEEGINKKQVKDAIVDAEGNLLLAFGDNHIVLADFRLQFIRNHDGQEFANASCVMADDEGNIWIANENGIFRHQGEFATDQFLESYFSKTNIKSNIVSMCQGTKHEIWFGTFGDGIGRIDTRTHKISMYQEKHGLINNNVLSICRSKNTIWMATLGGLCGLEFIEEKAVFKNFDSTSPLGSNFIYTVFNDNNDQLWLGTDGKGLVRFENDNFIFLNDRLPNAGKSVTAITEDGHGNIWFTSTDKGLQWTDGNTVTDVAMNTANEKVEIFSISNDAFGNIIALTSAGIAVLNNHTKHIIYVRPKFDIVSNYLNVISRDIKGQIWLCTSEALIRYNDFNLGRNLKPRTYIDGIEVMLQPVDTSRHDFRFDENHISFNLASIWLQEPEAILYQYKLIGFDVDWITTRDRKVIFSQIRPGKYKFLVRSSPNGIWEEASISEFSFEILEPFYRQSWFIITCISGGFIIVSLLLRARLNRVRRRESLARQKVQSQFDTLRNQINPHFLFNSFNTLNSIIAQNQSAAISYVEKLSDYFRLVLEQRDKDVITLKEELDLVQNYLYLQQQRFGENLIVQVNIEDRAASSLIPPLAIQLLVENAIKHNVISKSKPLLIKIQTDDQNLVISNNKQPKINREPSTGIGLENISNRYKILFGKAIQILQDENSFIVKLPMCFE